MQQDWRCKGSQCEQANVVGLFFLSPGFVECQIYFQLRNLCFERGIFQWPNDMGLNNTVTIGFIAILRFEGFGNNPIISFVSF
jgi:hypothetical protein